MSAPVNLLGSATALEQADAMSWRDFEDLVLQLFEANGYSCRHVGGRRDHGADIIATNADEVIGIQVKHREDGRRWVGERAVQAIVTAMPLYGCTGGVVVTNSSYAPGVKRVARAHGVTLRDRSWLDRELASFCLLCGRRVSSRVRNWCRERPEDYLGNTYCFDHQRRLAGLIRTA
jgi:HJR/Mrr/RecB family endonuclease